MPEGIYNKQKNMFFVNRIVYEIVQCSYWNTPEPEPESQYPVRDEKE